MSAIFSGLAREDRVLPLEPSRLDTESIARWRISVLSPAVEDSQSTVSTASQQHTTTHREVFARVEHYWHELQHHQRVDLSAATLRRLMPTRARVRRVAKVLPPTRRSQLLDRQVQQLIPSLCRSDSDSSSVPTTGGGDAEASQRPQRCLPLCGDSLERRAVMLHPFAASDLLLKLLCPSAVQHPLPFAAVTDRGRVLAERYANIFCVTSQQFHVFSCLVWVQLEAVAQRMSFQSFAELAVHVGDVTRHVLPMPPDAAKLYQQQEPLRKAVATMTEEWLAFRAMHISAATPCGVPAVLLTTDRSFLLGASSSMAEVLVPLVHGSIAKELHPFGLPPRTSDVGDNGPLTMLWRRIAALFVEYGVLLLVAPLQVLKQLLAEAAAAAPLRPPRCCSTTAVPRRSQRQKQDGNGAHGGGGAQQHQFDDAMMAPPLMLRTSEALGHETSELRCFTAADVADAVCHVGGPLLVPASSSSGVQTASAGGIPLRPTARVELSRTQRELIERLLSLRCRSMLAKAHQRGAALQWVVQRCSGRETTGSAAMAPQLALAVVHTNGAVTLLGSPCDIVTASGDAVATTTGRMQTEMQLSPSSRPEQLLENIPMSKITRGVIDNFIAAAVDHGARLLRAQNTAAVALQTTQPTTTTPAPQPLLRMMMHQLLIPVAVTATVLHYVLQCHPESRYIAGCGVRCLYVNSSGKLVVERVCYRFCEWDYRMSFKGGGASSMAHERRDRTLRDPMLLVRSSVHNPLPPNVAWSRIGLSSLLDMLQYYRKELDEALAHRPEAVPDKRMVLFNEDAAVVKYVLGHHPLYFARRGCGIDAIFVTVAKTTTGGSSNITGSSAAAVQHQQQDSAAQVALRGGHSDAGQCHVLRHCGTTVSFMVEECFDARGHLRLPDMLSEPSTTATGQQLQGMKRGRCDIDSLPW